MCIIVALVLILVVIFTCFKCICLYIMLLVTSVVFHPKITQFSKLCPEIYKIGPIVFQQVCFCGLSCLNFYM